MYSVRVEGDEVRIDFWGVMYNRDVVCITCIKRYVFYLKNIFYVFVCIKFTNISATILEIDGSIATPLLVDIHHLKI